ncbi:heat shock protein, Hsp70 family protein [Oceanicola granulosus HTCC2516]|uniref:Heat shock protein, Hsp70 family protein n=1 Tax=Oceanicola granulosus (strain ATCC BAA-861 / DSM 15982 / KCTC 12143 / HTCC2516) TaxID=314256 RepID=Q2CII3_OCEGH|nr:Hsp70 family protein [Oceanicola granulosus]EAR52606.1 heat shock protein, Hsp70 family protein [Oceanicola granulosus HTCC2516]
MGARLAVDFGTSNTAAAVLEGGRPRVIPLEGAEETLPTAVFLDFGARRTLFGHAAVAALIEGRDGRFMRALKSVLGTPLMHERRQFLQERLTLVEIVARFLAEVKARAEAATGQQFPRALSGRPVRFHHDPARDARAAADLAACYAAAGFEAVDFLPEPEAAALSAAAGDGLGLIVDIGGGTSDFTLFERAGDETRTLASHGVRIGGTDFDKALSLALVMPLLGKDSRIRAELGRATLPAPVALFNDLASWEKIPFLYGADTLRDVVRMARLAEEPEKFARLRDVLEMHLGHDVAFAVERGKIAANGSDRLHEIDLGVLERGLAAPLPPLALTATLRPFADNIAAAVDETLARAGVGAGAVGQVVCVGGSSLLAVVSDAVAARLPGAELRFGRAFTAIVDGLAIAAAR